MFAALDLAHTLYVTLALVAGVERHRERREHVAQWQRARWLRTLPRPFNAGSPTPRSSVDRAAAR
jgi:hypothetical protein